MTLASTDAIRKIREYRQSNLFDPSPNWPQEMIDERSWQQVGCDALIAKIREQPFADPMNIIEDFIIRMDDYANDHPYSYKMFQTYKEVGKSIGAMLDSPREVP